MLNKLNSILNLEFKSLEEILCFYQKELPERVKDFRLEEVGPIMSKGTQSEIQGYLKKIFSFNGLTMDMSSGEIDWYGTPNGDLEWNGGFVRQGYFIYLADEYEKTGDEIYASTIIEQMLDYIERVPRYEPEGKPYLEYKKSTWRPFEVAGRAAENWPVALAKIINSKSMTPEKWGKILLSVYDHADFLSVNHWKKGNHACLEVADLGIISIFYKEFKEAKEWLKYAINFLMGIWEHEFFEDGYTREMSGAYHWVAMRNFFAFFQVAYNNGLGNIFPKEYINRIYNSGRAEFYQEKPDYSVPVTNDSNITTNRRIQLEKIQKLFSDDEIKYRLSDGREGTLPKNTSYFFNTTRIGIMRSDWSREALYLFFDMGEWGCNHMNEDQLNIEVSAFGRNFLTNCGRWRYTTSPNVDWLPKAKYFKTTAAYNSVIVDGYNQVAGNADGFMKIYENYDFAEGNFEAGYGEESDKIDEKLLKEKGVANLKKVIVDDVTHIRQIIFVKPYFWIVRDIIESDGQHDAEQIWHFNEGSLKLFGNGQYVSTDFKDANLIMAVPEGSDIAPQIFCGSEAPFRGWHCPAYDKLKEAPELVYRNKNKVFDTLIFPVKGEVSEMPEFSKEQRSDCTVYKISYGSRKWEVKAPLNGEWSLL